eukprot:scaffold3183_cov120-Isochrysis_galbana.AAC.10
MINNAMIEVARALRAWRRLRSHAKARLSPSMHPAPKKRHMLDPGIREGPGQASGNNWLGHARLE